jgi:hypothetical protein
MKRPQAGEDNDIPFMKNELRDFPGTMDKPSIQPTLREKRILNWLKMACRRGTDARRVTSQTYCL